jgi:hypothetical protein
MLIEEMVHRSLLETHATVWACEPLFTQIDNLSSTQLVPSHETSKLEVNTRTEAEFTDYRGGASQDMPLWYTQELHKGIRHLKFKHLWNRIWLNNKTN